MPPRPEENRFELPDSPLLDIYDEAMSEDAELDALELLGDGTTRYAVIEEIGNGSWKKILLVHDLSTGRDVAMAIPRKSATDEMTARFIHEARILARLEHAAILRLYDLGLDSNEKPFFVTKYVSGTTLQDQVRAWHHAKATALSKWPLLRRIELFAQICSGVAYAHSRGVIHRDLKPDNILLDDYDQLLICDWGLARLIEGDDAHAPLLMDDSLATAEMRAATLDGVIKGTPGYMAPEQASGKNDDLGPATDIYALGAVLYALLVYRPPISGSSVKSIMHRTIQGLVVPPTEARPDLNLPIGLESIAMKALAKDPAARYESVSAMLTDLTAFTTGFAPEAQNAGLSTKATLFIRRNPRAIKVAAVGIIAVVGLTTYQINLQIQNRRDQAQLNEQRQVLSTSLAASQLETEKAHQEIIKEKQHRQLISEDAAIVIVDRAVNGFKTGDYPTAFRELNAAMTTSKINERMWRLDIILHMARFEVDEALEAAKHPTDPRYRGQSELPLLFSQRKTPEHFPDFIRHLQARRDSLVQSAACTLFPPTLPAGRTRQDMRLTLLKLVNPDQTTWSVTFTRKADGLAVNLSNHGNLTDITPVLGEDIVEINLRGTSTSFSKYVHNAKHVKRFLINSKQAKTAKLGSRAIVSDE